MNLAWNDLDRAYSRVILGTAVLSIFEITEERTHTVQTISGGRIQWWWISSESVKDALRRGFIVLEWSAPLSQRVTNVAVLALRITLDFLPRDDLDVGCQGGDRIELPAGHDGCLRRSEELVSLLKQTAWRLTITSEMQRYNGLPLDASTLARCRFVSVTRTRPGYPLVLRRLRLATPLGRNVVKTSCQNGSVSWYGGTVSEIRWSITG